MQEMILKNVNGVPYVEYSLKLKYTNNNGIPVKQIAESLLALETQIEFLPFSINRIFHYKRIRNLKVEKCIVRLTRLESGSLKEDIIIRLFFKSKKNLFRIIDNIRNKYKLDIMTEKFLVPILFGLIAGHLLNSCSGKNGTDSSVNIDMSNNNGVIIAGSEMYGMGTDEFIKILKDSTENISKSKQRKLQNSALNIVRPIQNGKGNLNITESENFVFKGNDIMNLPEKTTDDLIQEDAEVLNDVEIQIRALDRDNGKQGWKAIIPTISNARVKLVLPHDINLEELANNETIKGNVIVLWSTKDGKKRPKEYAIRSIIKK